MKHKFENGVLTISLEGHIDTANSQQISEEIFSMLDKYAPSAVILDAEKLEYISSSGLRIILRIRKRFSSLKVVNVSGEIYEILEMTGFTEMLTVEKAYRRLDITGCQIIGKGANGTVYRYDRDTIVKVYNENADPEEIKQERELSRTAFVLGVPTAIPYDVVKVGNCYGSVFELLNAKSFDELIIEDPSNIEFIVQKTVEIAKILHNTEAPDNLPSQQDVAMTWVSQLEGYFDEDDLTKLKQLINALPHRNTMIHGDLHIKNIMQQGDETLLIDLDTLSYGHPVYELAFMFNAYRGFGAADHSVIEKYMGISYDTAGIIWRRILEVYFGTKDPELIDVIEDKCALVGYLRLARHVIVKGRYNTADGKAFFDLCCDTMHKLLQKYDTLDFY